MVKIGFAIAWILLARVAVGQIAPALTVTIIDGVSREPLQGVSAVFYKEGKTSGTISNKEGRFFIPDPAAIDSLRVSMIGHESRTFHSNDLKTPAPLLISLNRLDAELTEIVVRPESAEEILAKAIKASKSMLPDSGFENHIFYREIIKDRDHYFSVAEALFKTQYFIKDASCRLGLIKGRSKEDVSYTRLFEDYHPGGGPQALIDKYFAVGFPNFLNPKKFGWFIYKKERPVTFDGKILWVISFDQKPTVHESLEKGRIFIDASDNAILRYEAENSPVGMAYIKDLKGSDKLFAELLNIEFKRKGWSRHVAFSEQNGRLLLSDAEAVYQIGYRQPKKNLDLDLSISIELAVTEPYMLISHPINKGEAWKRKDIVANLPTDFDPGFWGSGNIISPTEQVEKIIAGMSANNNEENVEKVANDWQYFRRDFFVAYNRPDSISLIPVMKAAWEDDETAGMIYMEMGSDITVETAVSIAKRTNPREAPDNGFQQAGLIIRNPSTKTENSLTLCMGTAGTSQPKFFLRKTENGKSKGPVDKIDAMNGWLRLEKRGSLLTAYFRSDTLAWKKIATYQFDALSGPVQVGLMVMARFAGSGPKAKPDMKAVFTHFAIESPGNPVQQ